MRSFTTAIFITLCGVLARIIYAHPSPFESPRATSNNIHVPIEELFVGAKMVSSGGPVGQTTDVVPVYSPESKREPIGNPCANDPCCKNYAAQRAFTQNYRWITKTATEYLGPTRRISEAVCPPASVTNSRTISYSYSINVQVGPDLKFGPAILDKFGIRVAFSYTWGTATTVGYTASCNDGNNFPCFAIFSPRFGKIYGTGWIETIGLDHKTVCSSTAKSEMEITVPIVASDACSGGDRNPCGAEGVYDHCFVAGQTALDICPRSGLKGKKPPRRICPAGIA